MHNNNGSIIYISLIIMFLEVKLSRQIIVIAIHFAIFQYSNYIDSGLLNIKRLMSTTFLVIFFEILGIQL